VGSTKRRAIQKRLKINGFWPIAAGTDDHSPMLILWVIDKGEGGKRKDLPRLKTKQVSIMPDQPMS
jgi:hypothetical protein